MGRRKGSMNIGAKHHADLRDPQEAAEYARGVFRRFAAGLAPLEINHQLKCYDANTIACLFLRNAIACGRDANWGIEHGTICHDDDRPEPI